MKRLLYAITASLVLVWASPSPAQFRAVYFDGDTLLFNNGGVQTVSESYGGTISYWYNSSFPKTAVITEVSASSSTNAPGMQVMHQYFGGGFRFMLYLAPAGQGGPTPWDPASSMRMVGDANLPYDGRWHSIVVTWDIRGFAADWALDGVLHDWDLSLTQIETQVYASAQRPFLVRYENVPGVGAKPARWFVGGGPSGGSAPYVALLFGNNRLGLFLAPTYFKFVGDLAETYFHVGDDDYTTIHNMHISAGFGENVVINGVGIARPLELGDRCAIIFGIAGGIPELCMRGDKDSFALNQGDSTAFVVQGTSQTALSDPFENWAIP